MAFIKIENKIYKGTGGSSVRSVEHQVAGLLPAEFWNLLQVSCFQSTFNRDRVDHGDIGHLLTVMISIYNVPGF